MHALKNIARSMNEWFIAAILAVTYSILIGLAAAMKRTWTLVTSDTSQNTSFAKFSGEKECRSSSAPY